MEAPGRCRHPVAYLTDAEISCAGNYGRVAMTVLLDDDALDSTFAALANSTRRAILARLAEGSATVKELAAPFDLTLPAVSKHIKVLERAGLVRRGHLAQTRPCAIEASRLRDVSTWAEQYRSVWESRFDQMGAYLMKMQMPDGTKGTR